MLCNESIINVFLGQNEIDYTDANCWFDCYHEIAFHLTKGYRLILETESYMILLGFDGVSIQIKSDFKPCKNEELEETIHIFDEDHEEIIDFENMLFVGQKLHSAEKCNGYFNLSFDDFVLKLVPHEESADVPSLRRKDHFSYNYVLGFERYITQKCPVCGSNGEILLDFVSDYVVRCKNCKNSTYAEMQIRHAIENWNKGEVEVDLSDITIE